VKFVSRWTVGVSIFARLYSPWLNIFYDWSYNCSNKGGYEILGRMHGTGLVTCHSEVCLKCYLLWLKGMSKLDNAFKPLYGHEEINLYTGKKYWIGNYLTCRSIRLWSALYRCCQSLCCLQDRWFIEWILPEISVGLLLQILNFTYNILWNQ